MEKRNDKNIKGIDISAWQDNVDLKKVYKAGYRVIIIKATEGVEFIDKEFLNHYKKAKEANLKIGVYHFMSDKTSPKKQANDFFNAIKDKKIDVYPVLDIEKDGFNRGRKEITDRCLEFLNEFKRLSGYDCIIYTYTDFARTKLDERLKPYKLWIAHYGVNAPSENGIWSSWSGFQFTDKEIVDGINTPCDRNEFTKDIFI